jgi:hypothetical protein
MDEDIRFIPAAFKHGIDEGDIRYALKYPQYEGPLEDDANRYIVLGFDLAGNLLEIMYNRLDDERLDDETVKVFHAMKCRSIFFHLLYA